MLRQILGICPFEPDDVIRASPNLGRIELTEEPNQATRTGRAI